MPVRFAGCAKVGAVTDPRPALDLSTTRALLPPRPIDLRGVATTGSTNVDLRSAAPAPGGFVVLTTEEQTAGRGRAGRTWTCPFGAGLMFSVRLVPRIPARELGWTGAVLGLSVRAALAPRVAVDLKWPNDLQIAGDKLGGILAEATGDGGVIVGVGLNVSVTRADLPRDDATSLLAEGIVVDRAELLGLVLVEFDRRVSRWERDGITSLLAEYRSACVSLGRRVRVELPDGAAVDGLAVGVDADGALMVRTDSGEQRTFAAGDVHHLR